MIYLHEFGFIFGSNFGKCAYTLNFGRNVPENPKMSKRTKGDFQFFLPKEDSSTVPLPEDEITKTIDLHIEDFLEKLSNLVDWRTDEEFISLPRVLIGNYRVHVRFWHNEDHSVFLEVENFDDGKYCNLRSVLVTGNIGNLALEERIDADPFEKISPNLPVKLGFVEELKESMTSSGNPKLDLQLTLTMLVTGDNDEHEDQWIISM